MSTVQFSLRIDPRIKKRLDLQAKLEDRSAAYVAQKALDEYLDRKEQMRRMLLDLEAEADKGVFISEEAMNAWVDSWDTDNESPPPKPDISPARYSRRK